jgi:Ni,Fe-hydrogenase III large subunit
MDACRRALARRRRESRQTVIGAYADRDTVHYLSIEPQGVKAQSQQRDGALLRSRSAELPLLLWDEREMATDWGVRFDGMPEPARVAQGEGIMHFVVGPVHAGIIEPGRFTFSSGGETVVHLDAQLGFAHRGVRRRLEGMGVLEAAYGVARICGSCSASRSFAYALAAEGLAGVCIPDEVELARLVVAELERIYNHLADLAASAAGAGYAVGFTHGMELKERAMRCNRLASGHRLLFGAIVPGGVANGVLADRAMLKRELFALESGVRRYCEQLFGNASVMSRWKRTGVVPRETSTAFGAVGPAHRASRGTVDLRAFAPYGAYRARSVHVAHATTGDVLARCSVKRDELAESFRLIGGALNELGDTLLAPAPVFRTAPGVARRAVEGPRGTELIALHVDAQQSIERIHVLAASYRNWPIVACAMENNIVPDFPLVNKSFNLCYACADR